jgi:GNAT superfamily N-acetyltransferase
MRAFERGDLTAVLKLFGRSVRQIAARDYDEEQIAAWAPEPPDTESWAERLSTGTVLVAEEGQRIAGFARLGENATIDLLYVDPAVERQGVGAKLMAKLTAVAEAKGFERLRAEVSKTARPFFETQGFRLVKAQTVMRRGVVFTNYCMEREEK